MKTTEEIQQMIDRLKAVQARIKADAQEYLETQTNPNTTELRQPLWRVAKRLAEWDKEFYKAQTNIELLEWAIGKREHFPW